MADDKLFGKGIGVAAGFDLGAQSPLDSRLVVGTEAELAEHVAGNRAYEGMLVYVKETGKTVQYTAAGAWEEFGFNDQKFQDGVKDVADEIRGEFAAADSKLAGRLDTLEGLVVGGEGEGIAAILGDVAELKGAVGAPAGKDEEGSPVEATGLHKAIAELQAKDVELVNKDKELEDKIKALMEGENSVESQIQGALEPVQEQLEGVAGDLEALQGVVGAPAVPGEDGAVGTPATGLHKVIEEANAAVVEELQGKIDDEVEALEGADALMQGRLDALEETTHDHENKEVLDGITGDMVSAWQAKATVEQVQEAQAAAEKHADDAITALVDSAPDAMNTLNELAQAINKHGDVYTAYVEEVNGKLAGKVDVVEGSRLVSEDEIAKWNACANAEDVAGSISATLQAAKDYADGKDEAIKAAKDAADAAQADVDALEKELKGEDGTGGISKEVADAKALAQQGVDNAALAQGRADEAFTAAEQAQAAADAAQEAADKAQDEVDALEGVVGAPAKDGAEATGLFAEIAALKAKDADLVGKDNALESRINTLEGFFTSGDDFEVGGLGEIQSSISELKGQVGQAAKDEQPATGLFADIAALQSKDTALQSAIEAEVQRATKAESDIRGEFAAGDNAVLAKVTQVETDYKAADAALEKEIADLETEINTLKSKDSTVEGDIKALQEKVGAPAVPGEEGTPATGLFAEIAALKAKEDLTPRVVALETGLAKEVQDARAAEKVNADAITALRGDMIATFAKIETEVKDGMVVTALVERDEEGTVIGSTPISEKPVDVMSDEDARGMLENIFAPAVEE